MQNEIEDKGRKEQDSSEASSLKNQNSRPPSPTSVTSSTSLEIEGEDKLAKISQRYSDSSSTEGQDYSDGIGGVDSTTSPSRSGSVSPANQDGASSSSLSLSPTVGGISGDSSGSASPVNQGGAWSPRYGELDFGDEIEVGHRAKASKAAKWAARFPNSQNKQKRAESTAKYVSKKVIPDAHGEEVGAAGGGGGASHAEREAKRKKKEHDFPGRGVGR